MKIENKELYRELSRPFESADLANETMRAFYAEVASAREKYRITEVLLVVSFSVAYEGGEGDAVSHATFGDSSRTEVLAAYALGQARADHRENINRIMSGKE